MKRSFLVCVFILSAAAMSFGQTTFYFPHVVNGAGWTTTIFLTNPAAAGSPNANPTITFTQDNATLTGGGTPMTVNFVDETGKATTGAISSLIAGGQSHKFVSDGNGAFVGGFATVTSAIPVTGVSIFSFRSGSTLIGEAGVPAATAATRQSIFVDIGNGYDVGVAFANPGTTAVNVALKVLDSNAQSVVSTTQVLGVGNHSAKFVYQFFGNNPLAPMSGTMQILGDGPLAAIALRFAPGSLFTTLPPVTIASLFQPAVDWFQHKSWSGSVVSLARLVASLQLHFG